MALMVARARDEEEEEEEVKEECAAVAVAVPEAVVAQEGYDLPSSSHDNTSLPLSAFDVEWKAPTSSPASRRFLHRLCLHDFASSLGLYFILITLATVIAVHIRPPHIGLVILSLLPALFILSYLQRRFSKSVVPMQIAFTFFECILYMCPIVILENIYSRALRIAGLPRQGSGYSPLSVFSYFIQSYTVAGLFEEVAKYLAVRRILFDPHIIDHQGLLVYAASAGAAFGTVENVFFYVLRNGVATGIVRAFISVPLHVGTAQLLGLSLAHSRFVRSDRKERWYRSLSLPVLVHGTFDVVIYLLWVTDPMLRNLGSLLGLVIVVGIFLSVRYWHLGMTKAYPPAGVDVRHLIRQGLIQGPSWCKCGMVVIGSVVALVGMLLLFMSGVRLV